MQSEIKKIIQAEMMLDLQTGRNWINIPPPFDYFRVPSEDTLKSPPEGIKVFFKYFDYLYWTRKLGLHMPYEEFSEIFKESIFGDAGYGWEVFPAGTPPSLVKQLLRKESFFNRVFAGDKHGPYTHKSTANMFPNKVIKLAEKYNQNTHTLNNSPILAHCLGNGLNNMYEYMDVKKYFNKLTWNWDEDLVKLLKIPDRKSVV